MSITLNSLSGKLLIYILFSSFPEVLSCSFIWKVSFVSPFFLTLFVSMYSVYQPHLLLLKGWPYVEGVLWDPVTQSPKVMSQVLQGYSYVDWVSPPVVFGSLALGVLVYAARPSHDSCGSADVQGWSPGQLTERSGHDCCRCAGVQSCLPSMEAALEGLAVGGRIGGAGPQGNTRAGPTALAKLMESDRIDASAKPARWKKS